MWDSELKDNSGRTKYPFFLITEVFHPHGCVYLCVSHDSWSISPRVQKRKETKGIATYVTDPSDATSIFIYSATLIYFKIIYPFQVFIIFI